MRPIRLAVIFDQQIRAGGGYQQALNAALLTRELPRELAEVIFFTTLQENIATLAIHGIKAKTIKLSLFAKIRAYFRRRITEARLLKVLQKIEQYSPFEKQLIKQKIDLVYFLSPSSWARNLEKLNYITTVWDLCHRDDPEFPEVRWDRELEARDKKFRSLLPGATAVFVDSDLGKRNVIHRYGIDENRVYVMPFQAAPASRQFMTLGAKSSTDVHKKYDLEMPYVYYPAQFWAHKNHVYLLRGLRILEDRYGLSIGAIFSGGDQGNLARVQSCVRELGLEDRVRFVGFVANDQIPTLYSSSIALVMPSYFGPTNLPPLEAFELGVPVLYSNKAGLSDQVGDAALLMDLHDPGSMADQLKKLVDDPDLRKRLAVLAKKRLEYFDSLDRLGLLKKILAEFRHKRITW